MNCIYSDKGLYLGMHPVIYIALFDPEKKEFRTLISSPLFDGFFPFAWEDYRSPEVGIPIVWTVYFTGYNLPCTKRIFESDRKLEFNH
jgi:hypothetical protein